MSKVKKLGGLSNNEIAVHISKEFDIRTIFNSFHIKNEGYYQQLSDSEVEKIIYDSCVEIHTERNLLTQANIKEIKFLLKNIKFASSVNPSNAYCFRNGELILNEKGKVIFQENVTNVFTFRSDLDFIKNFSTKNIINFLDGVLSEKDQTQFLEMLAFAMFPALRERINFDSVLFCYGTGANGKSVLLESIIHPIYGNGAISAVRLESLKDRFQMASLLGKRLNIATENESSFIFESPQLKSITSGDSQSVEKKFQDSFMAKIFAVMIFCINKELFIGNVTHATLRRLRIANFNSTFVDKLSEKNIINNQKLAIPELRNAKDTKTIELQHGLCQMIIETAERLWITKKMTSSNMEDILNLQTKSSHIRQFAHECFEFSFLDENLSEDLFESYKKYCIQENLADSNFSKMFDPNPRYDKVLRSSSSLSKKILELFPDKLKAGRANNSQRKIVGLRIKDSWRVSKTSDTSDTNETLKNKKKRKF